MLRPLGNIHRDPPRLVFGALPLIVALDEDGGILLDRGSLLATHQALRTIAVFAVGRSVSGELEIGPVILGER